MYSLISSMWALRASVSAWQMYIVLVLNTVRYLLLFLERTQSDVFFLPWTHSVRCFFLKQTVRDKDEDRHWDPELNQQPDGGAVQVSFLLQLLLQLLRLQRFPGHLRGFWSKQYCRLFMCLSPLCVFVNQSDSTSIWRFTFLFPSDLVSPPPPPPPPSSSRAKHPSNERRNSETWYGPAWSSCA